MEPLAVAYPDNLATLGVCRGLGEHGVRTAVLATGRTAPGQYSRYADRVPCPPASDEAAFIDFLVRFGQAQRQRPVLFMTDDSSLLAVHRHHETLERWYRFPLGPWSALEPLMRKDALYGELEGVVPVPRTAVAREEAGLPGIADTVGFPAIAKPVLRCLTDAPADEALPFEKVFGAKAVRVRSLDELRSTWRQARAHGFTLVVQEEIEGPITALYSVGLCATRTGGVVAFTSQKLGQVPAEFGDGLVVKAAYAPALIPLAERAIRHFGFRGLADIEFKWDPRTGLWKLLDINPRPWLWINLPQACGVNLAWAAYLDAVGRPVSREAFEQRDFETRWVSMRGVAIAAVRALVSGRSRHTLPALARQLRGPRVGPLWNPRDALVRMVLSPGYWTETLQDSLQSIRHLRAAESRGRATAPQLARSDANAEVR
jgi:predicted ATP-grasp superfamily ATP-dependent carboligase